MSSGIRERDLGPSHSLSLPLSLYLLSSHICTCALCIVHAHVVEHVDASLNDSDYLVRD